MATIQEVLSKETETLAIGCLHLLVDHATLDFPGSTKSTPSRLVIVSLTPKGPLWKSAFKRFPFSVPWNIWQQTVVPVLEDDSLLFFDPYGGVNQINVAELSSGSTTSLIAKIQSALITKLVEYGYAPNPDSFSEPTEALGSGGLVTLEISDDETSGSFAYTQFDE